LESKISTINLTQEKGEGREGDQKQSGLLSPTENNKSLYNTQKGGVKKG